MDKPSINIEPPTRRVQTRTLHVIYRSCGGENRKGRPDYYDKDVALASLLRSLEQVDAACEVTFLNDGPIPDNRLKRMERHGDVICRQGLGGAGSMRATLDLVAGRRYGRDDLVFLSEDDHLYKVAAFRQLCHAADLMPEADYFGLYASIGHRAPDGKDQPVFAHVPRRWRPYTVKLVDKQIWCRGLSTTSSFGARPKALKRDIPMMTLAMRSGGAWDHTTCLMYQGYLPFAWTGLTRHFGDEASWRRKLQSAAIRTAMNGIQAARRVVRSPRHLLIAADPSLATHLESDHLAVGTDWSSVAAQCRHWTARSDPDRDIVRELRGSGPSELGAAAL